jgi:hypothetical protein
MGIAELISDNLQACDHTKGKCAVEEDEEVYCDPETGICTGEDYEV